MRLEDQDIGELFRDAFDGFEADVKGDLWNNIQSRVESGSAGSSAGASASGSSLGGGMITGIAVTSAIVGATIFYFATGGDDVPTETTTPSNNIEYVTENQPTELTPNTEEATPAPVVITTEELTLTDAEQRQVDAEEKHADTNKYIITEEDAYQSPQKSAIDRWLSPRNVNNNSTGYSVDDNAGTSTATETATADAATTVDNTATTTNDPAAEETTAVTIEVAPAEAPRAYIEASTVGGYAPLAVEFNSGFEAESYDWDFGDAQSNSADADHVFTEPGLYPVSLTVYNKDGASHTDRIMIEVKASSEIPKESIPNVFSPNGDGINEVFTFEKVNIQAIYMVISDRNGRVVYETNDLQSTWDGTDKGGQAAAKGTYVYIIKAIGIDGNVILREGTVTLLR